MFFFLFAMQSSCCLKSSEETATYRLSYSSRLSGMDFQTALPSPQPPEASGGLEGFVELLKGEVQLPADLVFAVTQVQEPPLPR